MNFDGTQVHTLCDRILGELPHDKIPWAGGNQEMRFFIKNNADITIEVYFTAVFLHQCT